MMPLYLAAMTRISQYPVCSLHFSDILVAIFQRCAILTPTGRGGKMRILYEQSHTGGAVLDVEETVSFDGGYGKLQGDYLCSESIGQIRNEEIVTPYGNDQ